MAAAAAETTASLPEDDSGEVLRALEQLLLSAMYEEFVLHGTLVIAGQRARRIVALVRRLSSFAGDDLCPTLATLVATVADRALSSGASQDDEREAAVLERAKRVADSVAEGALECAVCCAIMLEPVSLFESCGHAFCRECVARSLDSSNLCPNCREPVRRGYIDRSYPVSRALDALVRRNCANALAERIAESEAAIRVLEGGTLPLFVCSVSLPTAHVPLHIFEPRYRLLVRRCMEADDHCFGMVPWLGQVDADGDNANPDMHSGAVGVLLRINGNPRMLVSPLHGGAVRHASHCKNAARWPMLDLVRRHAPLSRARS